eukprot:6363104-Karenia_brevis.AAC.1
MGYRNDWGRHNSPYGDAQGYGNGKDDGKAGYQNNGGKGVGYVPPRPKFGGVPCTKNDGAPNRGASSHGAPNYGPFSHGASSYGPAKAQ